MDIINSVFIILELIAMAIMLVYVPYKLYFSQKEEKFTCYEIWRPNIPDDGCKKQCNACKEEEQLKLKKWN